MAFLLGAVAILEFLGGLAFFAGAKSAIHEIEGLIMIGSSFATLGIASLVYRAAGVDHSARSIDGRVAELQAEMALRGQTVDRLVDIFEHARASRISS